MLSRGNRRTGSIAKNGGWDFIGMSETEADEILALKKDAPSVERAASQGW